MSAFDIHHHKNITLEQAINGTEFKLHLDGGRTVKVKLNPGSYNGKVLRLKELGNLSKNGVSGDLYLKLKILNHPLYQVEGLNILSVLYVTAAEAKMGARKHMPGPDGSRITIDVQANSKSGDIISVDKPALQKGDDQGKICYKIKIIKPDKIDPEKLLEYFNTNPTLLN